MPRLRQSNLFEKPKNIIQEIQFPSWVEEYIYPNQKHFVLTYSEIHHEQGIKVALLGRRKLWNYELLVLQLLTSDPHIQELIRKRIEGFIRLNEPYLWDYLCYHCGTMSNFYDKIHFQLSTKSYDRIYKLVKRGFLIRKGQIRNEVQEKKKRPLSGKQIDQTLLAEHKTWSGGCKYEPQYGIGWNKPVRRQGANCDKCGKKAYWLFNTGGGGAGMGRALFYCPECNYQFTRK